MFWCSGLLALFHTSKLGRFWLSAAAVLLPMVVASMSSGCKKTPTSTANDQASTPWLDPQSQIKGLKDKDYRIRGLSAFNLGNMGAKAAEAVPELERLAHDDSNEKVRENARQAVEKIRAATTNPKH